MRPCLSPLGEEISQDGLTLAFQHAAVHFRTMADTIGFLSGSTAPFA